MTFGVDDRAHGAQRRAEAAVRKCVVELRDFQRRDVDRAEQHGGQLRRLFRQSKRDELARHFRQTHFQTQTHRGEIHGLRERSHERHRSVELLGNVLRRPHFPVGQFHFHRSVLDDGRGVVAAALDGREIDHRLHQRADRALRIERAIETVEARLPAADQCDDFAVLRRRDDDDAFKFAVVLLLARFVEPVEFLRQAPARRGSAPAD